jgi:cytochrome c oxidase cbb3-type subunit 3
MQMHSVFGWAAATLLTIAAAFGQGHNTGEPQRPPDTPKADLAAVERGHAEFKSSCGFCHGEDATGSRAPDLVRSTLVLHDDHGSLLVPMIRNGRPDKGMPSFATLKEDQLADIVAFLHNQAELARHSAHVPGDYPLRKLLTGNADAGKAFFFGAGGCAECHSVTGDLKGIAAKLSPIDLQQNMVYPAGKNTPPTTATVTTKDGQKFEGTIVHDDEFRIGIKCQDGWYRSWAVDEVEVEKHDPLERHRALMSVYKNADIHNLFAYLETLK